MRRAYPLIAALVAAALVAGCGDDNRSYDPPQASAAEVFRSNLNAQCFDAKERQQDLTSPTLGDSQSLAAYMRKILALERELRRRLLSFKPPADLAAGVTKALNQERRLTDIVAGYERAAQGGRDFDLVLRQLQNRLNPQIRVANRAFGEIEVPGCEAEELDLGFDQNP